MLHCDVYDNKNLYVIFMLLKISFGLYLYCMLLSCMHLFIQL